MFRSVKQSLLATAIGLAVAAVALFALSCAPAPPKVRFVDDAGLPVTKSVRVLCYTAALTGTLLADQAVETDEDGRPVDDLPSGCDYLAALQQKYEQPASPDRPGHGPAYQIYATSWEPGATTPLRATGNITISDRWPLVLFNVVASLAWEPAVDGDPVVEDLEIGLLQASAYLYDVTDGRMAFGPVEIHTGGRNWNSADLRFLAANDYRPSAYVGGMVAGRLHYTSSVASVVFSPGEIYLGRDWSRHGASDESSGRWYTDDAHRTIIHEWAHYALFLYDEYQDVTGGSPSRAYCTCTALSAASGSCLGPAYGHQKEASIMAWQYQASELWHPGVPPPVSGANLCEETEQFQIHGQSDWETLAAWYQIQGMSGLPELPPLDHPPGFSDLNEGPGLGLVGDLFGTVAGGIPTPPPAPGQAINVMLTGSLDDAETPQSQVYLLKSPAGPTPRILNQGKVDGSSALAPGHLGTIHILGAEPGDELGVFVERQVTEGVSDGGRYTFRGPLPAGPVTASVDPWRAGLDITPILDGSRLTGLQVVLTSLSHPDLAPPTVQLCTPDAGAGCFLENVMTQVNETTWTSNLTLPGGADLPRYGVLRVRAEGVGEIIRWFQDGGGVPPAHDDGGSPVADGRLKLHTNDPIPDSNLCNRFVFMPAASYRALTSSLGTVRQGRDEEEQDRPEVMVQGVLEVPLDIDIVLPRDGACPALAAGDHTLPVSVTLTLFYDQGSVDRLLGEQQRQEGFLFDENNLQVLHYDQASNRWSQVPVAGRDPDLNWIATEPVGQDGIYAIVWTAAGSPPTATIIRPADDSGPNDEEYTYDDFDPDLGLWYKDVTLVGAATDPEDGPLGDAALAWTTDRTDIQSAVLGAGAEVTARLYSNECTGVWHEITLTATDSDGNTGTALRKIRIWTLC